MKDASAKKDESATILKDKYSREVKFVAAPDLVGADWRAESYLIDIDDILEVSVWQVEELNREIIVRPDGKISFPLIGDIQAQGRTVEELRQEIMDKIKLYIKSPQVSVNIRELGGKRASVMGDVVSPGVIRFTSPIRITEALALAGGFTQTASKGAVLVIRNLDTESPTIIVSDLGKLIYQADLRENIVIRHGDIIYVQTSLLGSVSQFLNTFMDGAFAKVVNYAEDYYGFTWRRQMPIDLTGGNKRKWRWPTGAQSL